MKEITHRKDAKEYSSLVNGQWSFILCVLCVLAVNNLMYAQSNKIERIGVQLYTLRTEMEKDFEGTLKKVADAGYKEVEFAGYFGKKPAHIKKLLSRLQLEAVGTHPAFHDLKNNPEKVIAEAEEIGIPYIVIGWFPEKERKTIRQYEELAVLFNKFGKACKARGIQFAYHNHDFEFRPLNGKVPYDVLLDKMEPGLVKMELDLYWIAKAGKDPLTYFKQYPGRFPLCHVKDMGPDSAQSMQDVGKGIIDFPAIFRKRDLAGLKHFIVEHDNPSDPLASIRNSYQYLKKLGF
jgi:sugar phosphate isomerase/epimerase